MKPAKQRHYDIVAAELENRVLHTGLWTRAVAETGEEGAAARARYINLRVAELATQEEIEKAVARGKRRKAPLVFLLLIIAFLIFLIRML